MSNGRNGDGDGSSPPSAVDASDDLTIIGGADSRFRETHRINELTRSIDRPIDSLWELLITEPGSTRWLGSDGPPAPGVPFAAVVAPQLHGVVGSLQVGEGTRSIYLDLNGRSKPVRVGLVSMPSNATLVQVEDQFLSFEPETSKAWVAVLDAITKCHVELAERSPRQAVVVVHGIGEQRRGKTIEAFVARLHEAKIGDRVQPYRQRFASGTATPRYRAEASADHHPDHLDDASRPRRAETDFYEYYWAHYAGGTTLGQVFSWMLRLLFRFPKTAGTRRVWLFGWALVGGLTIGGVTQARIQQLPSLWVVLALLLAVGLVVARFLRNYVGDAARYLGHAPENVELRERIKQQGVELVRSLHDSLDYDRVVVVGHSLGSVVAYDIVCRYWTEVYNRSGRPGRSSDAARQSLAALPATGSIEYQNAQNELWVEQRLNGHRWLITDLVTLGSPLAHAELVLAEGKGDFTRAKEQLERPTCPPVSWQGVGANGDSLPALDHGSPFAPTRWTNLYYSGIGIGDPVGGPLASGFGAGVVDRGVSPGFDLRYWSVLGHPKYARGPALGTLLDALALGSEEWLRDLNAQLPLGARLKPEAE